MRMALKLARRGVGSVEPNPAVGCVIVKDNKIIGTGWHKKFGGPHAEINALEDCKRSGISPQNAAMYVTLEPCCHHGKTAPCTDAIIADGLAKIVVAMLDPSKHTNGKGIEQLRNAGIEVEIGPCETEAELLNAPFIKFAATGKPWVILKWAQTIDGKLGYCSTAIPSTLLGTGLAVSSRAGSPCHGWISNEQSRKDVHKLRRRVGGILAGINTIIADDPLLTARPGKGKKPTRIVLDSQLRIPADCKLLATAKKVPVLIVADAEIIKTNHQAVEKISQKGAELLAVPTEQGKCALDFLMNELSKRNIAQLLVEGGPTVITSFLKQRLADEIVVYIAPKILGSQGSVSISEPMAELTEAVGLHYVDIKHFSGDVRISGLTARGTEL